MVKPLIALPPQLEKKETGRIVMIRQYKLITPLFGGGTTPGEVDKKAPIRGTSIRGQLRFWWRATCGGRFGEDGLQAMKEREDEIWGAAAIGSKISIAVTELNVGKTIDIGSPSSSLGYATFPLRESNGTLQENVSFTLRIECPKIYRPDLKASLWAWETFGGIGARTRRGFGALQCTAVQLYIDDKKYNTQNWTWAYSSENAKDAILWDLEKLTNGSDFPAFVTHLSQNPARIHITPAQNHASSSWLELISSLKEFRQSRSGRFGRSHWPEPDAIRNLTGQSLKARHHDIPVYNPPIYKFPRAAFGLPIVFEFKDDDDNHQANPNADPRKTELKGTRSDRRASRVLLRTLPCSDGRYVGLAIILQGDTLPPGGLELKNSPTNPSAHAEVLTASEAGTIKKKHPNYDGSVDILQAFLNQLPR